jgi:hypothetical protein
MKSFAFICVFLIMNLSVAEGSDAKYLAKKCQDLLKSKSLHKTRKPVANSEISEFLQFGDGKGNIPGTLNLSAAVNPKKNKVVASYTSGPHATVDSIEVVRHMDNVNNGLFINKETLQVFLVSEKLGAITYENIKFPERVVYHDLPDGFRTWVDYYDDKYFLTYKNGILSKEKSVTYFGDDGSVYTDLSVMRLYINPALTYISKIEYSITRTTDGISEVITNVESRWKFAPIKEANRHIWGEKLKKLPTGPYFFITDFIKLTHN